MLRPPIQPHKVSAQTLLSCQVIGHQRRPIFENINIFYSTTPPSQRTEAGVLVTGTNN